MQYKVIQSPSKVVSPQTILDHYDEFITAENLREVASQAWEKIKTNKDYLYTLDTIFYIWHAHILIENELIIFLKLIQKNPVLCQALCDRICDETTFKNWSSITREQLEQEYTSVTVQRLNQQLTTTRLESCSELRDLLRGDKIQLFFLHCPLFLNGLSVEILQAVITTNPKAIVLFKDKLLANRFAVILMREQLIKMFALSVPVDDQKEFLQLLLEFCQTRRKGFFGVFFERLRLPSCSHLLPSTNNESLTPADLLQIRKNLIAGADDLLRLFQNNKGLGSIYIRDGQDLVDLLSCSALPLRELSNLCKKDPQVANKVGEHIVKIAAYLFRAMPTDKRAELGQFLLFKPSGTYDYLTLLFHKVYDNLQALNKPSLGTIDNFQILLQPEIRTKLRENKKILTALLNMRWLNGVMDRIIFEDDAIYELVVMNLVPINDYSALNFPLTAARRSMEKKVVLSQMPNEYERPFSPLEAFALPVSIEGFSYFTRLPNNQPDLSNRLVRLKLLHQAQKSTGACSDYVIDHLSKHPVLWAGDLCFHECLDLIAFLGSGQHIIVCLSTLYGLKRMDAPEIDKSIINRSINYLFNYVLTNDYVMSKVISAITFNNILGVAEIFYHPKMQDYLPSRTMVQAASTLPVEARHSFLLQLASKKVIIKLFAESYYQVYCQELVNLLDDKNFIDRLFKDFTDVDLYDLLRCLSPVTAEFIFSNDNCDVLAQRMINVIISNWKHIDNRTAIHKLFHSQKGLVQFCSRLDLEKLVIVLESMEPKLTQLFLAQSHHIPLESLLADTKNLINIICNNTEFGLYFFASWQNLIGINLVIDQLLYQLFSREHQDVLEKYLDSKIVNFWAMVRTMINHISPETYKYLVASYSRLAGLRHDNVEEEINKIHFPSSRDSAPLVAAALFLVETAEEKSLSNTESNDLLKAIVSGEVEAYRNLFDAIIKNKISSDSNVLPVILLLNDRFYDFFTENAKHPERYHLVYNYLSSLPRDYLEGLSNLVKESSLSKVAFVKLHNRLNHTTIVYLWNLMTQLQSSVDVQLAKRFLDVLSLTVENCCNTIRGFIKTSPLFESIIIKALKLTASGDIRFNYDGEILLRLLLIKHHLNMAKESNTSLSQDLKNIVQKFSQELSVQTRSLRANNANYVRRLFKSEDMLHGDIQLVSYLIRHNLCPRLSENDLLAIAEKASSLGYTMLLYSHHLPSLTKKGQLKLSSKLQLNSDSLLRIRLASDPDTTPGPKSSTTASLRNRLAVSKHVSHKENYEDVTRVYLETALPDNNLLAFLKEAGCYDFVKMAHDYDPLRSYFEIMEQIIVLVVDERLPDFEGRYDEVMKMLPRNQTINFNRDLVIQWQKTFAREEYNSFERELITRILTQVSEGPNLRVESGSAIQFEDIAPSLSK